ncbi:MAG: hypothetical protein ACI8PZ_003567 [Myxococcota bacterium]|jgi:hypothetical protein
MSHLTTLLRQCGSFAGHGINHEDQPFHGELRLEPLLENRGVGGWFRATGIDGTTYHEERTWIAAGASGGLSLWSLSTNAPGVLEHTLRHTADGVFTFGHGDPHDETRFRHTLTITLHHDGITWAYGWAMPGEALVDRSGVRLGRQ